MRTKLYPPLVTSVLLLFAATHSEVAEAAPAGITASAFDQGDDSYAYIVGLLERGLNELAIEEATKFLADFPDHPRANMARYRLAITLFDNGRRSECAAHFRILGTKPGFMFATECRFRLGQCELEGGKLGEARAAFLGTIDGAKGDQKYLEAPATFLLGEVAFQAKSETQAAETWGRYLARFPDSEHAAAAQRGLAWCAWRVGDAAETITQCQTFLRDREDPVFTDELNVLLGEALLETGAHGAALTAFSAVTTKAQGAASWRGIGFAHAALGAHGKAAGAFGRVVSDFPSSPLVHEATLQQGVEYLRAGQLKLSVASLKKAAGGGDLESLLWLSKAQLEAGQGQAALASLDRADTQQPAETMATRIKVARGDTLTALGRAEAARAAYESAGSDWALHAAAVAALNEGLALAQPKTEDAERLARRLIKLHPTSPYLAKTHMVLGEALFARGLYVPAANSFEAAAKSSAEADDAARARSRFAWCAYLDGRFVDAVNAFGVLIARHPASAPAQEASYMVARASREAGNGKVASQQTATYLAAYPKGEWADDLLLAEGLADDSSEASQSLLVLVSEWPNSKLLPDALFELGERNSTAGKREQAAAFYGRVVEAHPNHSLAPRAHYGLAWCAFDGGEFAKAASHLAPLAPHSKAARDLKEAACELLIWCHINAKQPKLASGAWADLASLTHDETRLFQAGLAVAEAWKTAGKSDQALAFLTRQLRSLKDPNLGAETLVEATFAALGAGSIAGAEQQLHSARQLAKQVPSTGLTGLLSEAAFFIGEAHFATGDVLAAETHYKAATIAGSPVIAQALYKLGFGQLETQRPKLAAVNFERLVNDFEEHDLCGEALFLLGEARFRQDDFAGVVEPLARLLKQYPDHAVVNKARFRLGVALGQLGRFDSSEAVLNELARNAPDFPNLAEAELWRGRALGASGKVRPARQALDRSMALDAKAGAGVLSALCRIEMGKLSESEGDFDEALSAYLKVAVLYADDDAVATALVGAGRCLEAQGDFVNARGRYEEVVAEHGQSTSFKAAQQALSRLRNQ